MFMMTASYWLKENPEMKIPHAVGATEAFCLDIMMGYLWYDIGYEMVDTWQADAIGHHILGLISHMSSRLSNNGAAGFYSMLVYIAEGSTPFLNISWLLHQLQMKNTLLFKVFALLLILSFFVFRIILGPFMVWHMLTHKKEWGPDAQGLLFWGNWVIVALFALLNYYWFYKIIQVATGAGGSSKKKESKEK
jgi:TLC domain